MILNADPTVALGAATKQYVDNHIKVLFNGQINGGRITTVEGLEKVQFAVGLANSSAQYPNLVAFTSDGSSIILQNGYYKVLRFFLIVSNGVDETISFGNSGQSNDYVSQSSNGYLDGRIRSDETCSVFILKVK